MPDQSHEQVVDELAYRFVYALKIGRVHESLRYRRHLVEFEEDAKEDCVRERTRLYNSLIGQKI